jgi:hypothetical protein
MMRSLSPACGSSAAVAGDMTLLSAMSVLSVLSVAVYCVDGSREASISVQNWAHLHHESSANRLQRMHSGMELLVQ